MEQGEIPDPCSCHRYEGGDADTGSDKKYRSISLTINQIAFGSTYSKIGSGFQCSQNTAETSMIDSFDEKMQ